MYVSILRVTLCEETRREREREREREKLTTVFVDVSMPDTNTM